MSVSVTSVSFANRTLALLAGASLVALARAGVPDTTYTLLRKHSSLTYTFTQAGGANQGRFKRYAVSFDPAAGRLRVVIDMRSFDTGDGQRNGILAGKSFFDVAQYPRASFTASGLRKTAAGYRAAGYRAVGQLTLRGVTRTVVVPFTWHLARVDGHRVGLLSGKTTIRRLNFGIGQGQWHSTEWVGNAVTVHFALELVPSG